GDRFGYSIAISGDTLAIGAQVEDGNATGVGSGTQADGSILEDSGAVYVFRMTDAGWAQEAYIKASNTGIGDVFGSAISLDGDRLVIGAYREDSNASGVNPAGQSDNSLNDSGAVYVFHRTGVTWVQEAFIKSPNPGSDDHFGIAVDIDGDRIAVGATKEDGDGDLVSDSGAAYIFRRENSVWSQEAYLKAPNADADDRFGYGVAISQDTLVVGAPYEESPGKGINAPADENTASSGAAYVFRFVDDNWVSEAYIKASNTDAGDLFACAVDIDNDTIVIGAYLESSAATTINGNHADNSANGAGAAYVFHRVGDTWWQEAYLKSSATRANYSFGYDVAIVGESIVIGAYGDASAGQDKAGAAYHFTRDGSTWSQEKQLQAAVPGVLAYFGQSVAVGVNAIAVGSPRHSSALGLAGAQSYSCAGEDCDNSLANDDCNTCTASLSCAFYSGAAYLFR
ncbi:MAG: FG-GAP repeat protein, partial [Kofleriaceae bacterium]|nr:FG-GAP repeat protein [Kofleriaceae bacterium]